ncbi:DUF4105 domain-containing protein [Methylobacillus arboreus]|uniref:Lnb N-terminal periplasmic domain-containing protein n=1 Tax=Methylobacillus arboreus TaxID=755170 RepID=UPI001E3CD828|nr:DUF4105 domain-containing protein [Methylobacillus arboreus]MCB5190195.1 DUF4105 domain-containing protein [Methylobacillus arboreus]
MGRFFRLAISFLLGLVFLLSVVWGTFALYYQFPSTQPLKFLAIAGWLGIAGASLTVRRYGTKRGSLVYIAALACLLGWWQSLAPSNEREWADDVAETTTAIQNGSVVTFSHVRNFDWRSETDYTPRWEQRRYDLDQLQSVDMLLSYWTGPAIAHTLVSFGFGDGRYLVFSVEIRKERHESFSEVGGFFKEFETSIIAADERDIIRVRTNIRGEDVYRYRVHMPQEAMRELFLAYATEANRLAQKPRFYHTVTANCTTIVYHMVRQIIPGLPMDYRLLLSGYLPEYLYSIGGLDTALPLEALRQHGRITDKAKAADRDPDFSSAIRRNPPSSGLS